jgi:hypothetical protein
MTAPVHSEDQPAEAAKPTGHGRGRRIGASVCLVLSVLLAPLAIVTTWTKQELLNTDRYVATVAPLADNRGLTDYLAGQVTEKLMTGLNVTAVARESLPKRAQFLAAPLTGGIQTLVTNTAETALASPEFKKIWTDANRAAHNQVQKALTGEGNTVTVVNGKVTIDLSPIIQAVVKRLDARGITVFDKIPIVHTAIKLQLFDAQGLASAQQATKILVILRYVLAGVAIILALVGFWLSRDRRRSAVHWGFGLAACLGVVAAILLIGSNVAASSISKNGMPQNTALAVIKQMTYYLRLSLRAGMTAGLIIALVAVLLGPGKAAVKVRATLSAAFDRAPEGHGGGVITRFVAANRQAIRAVGVVLALALLVAGLTPGAIGVLLAALALAVYLAIVEILARAGGAGSEAGPGEDGTPTPESGSVGSA